MLSLHDLGNRICILGCSNSGKSTLADALSNKLTISAHHLDQYPHVENSNWHRYSDEILIKRHSNIFKENSCIIDGNYSVSFG